MNIKEYVLVYLERSEFGQILMVLKDKPEWQKDRLNLIGGKIEPNETPEEAAFRELKEESGFGARTVTLFGKIIAKDAIVYCYKAFALWTRADIRPRHGETEKVSWHTWAEVQLDKRLIPNLRVIIPLMQANVKDWSITDMEVSGLTQNSHDLQMTIPTYMNG
jgi:8-oxo-dGTP pyrophosphatase MutT (NUDIX family)